MVKLDLGTRERPNHQSLKDNEMNAVLKYVVSHRPDMVDQLLGSSSIEYLVSGQWVRYAGPDLGSIGKGNFSVDWTKITDIRANVEGKSDFTQPTAIEPRVTVTKDGLSDS